MTHRDLLDLFRQLGVSGINAIVHASIASIGEIEGGARTFSEALVRAAAPDGTIIMPAFTGTKTIFGGWMEPVPYQPDLPVARELGTICETFRLLPGVQRSNHPTHSFAAFGPRAQQMLSTQRDNNTLGPIKKLNISRGYVLLIGLDLSSAVAIHVAEEMVNPRYLGRAVASRVNAAGFPERVIVENLPGCSRAFHRLEERLDPAEVVEVAFPAGRARKIAVRSLVRLATTALAQDPLFFVCDLPNCVACSAKRTAVERGTEPFSR